MSLYLVRHTRVAVPKGICYGQSDVSLAASFLDEAAAAKQQLDKLNLTQVFSSPLSRCTRLAHWIFPQHEIEIDARLAEMNFGQWEMESWDTIHASTRGKQWFSDFVAVQCPQGESFADLIARANSFCHSVKERVQTEDVVVFTHAGFIRALLHAAEGIAAYDTFSIDIPYGAIKKFRI